MSDSGPHKHQSFGCSLLIMLLTFIMGMGFTEGSGEGSWIMPLFWAFTVGVGFLAFDGEE